MLTVEPRWFFRILSCSTRVTQAYFFGGAVVSPAIRSLCSAYLTHYSLRPHSSSYQARATAILSMVPSDKDVLIGSKCLSCNRPLGGFGTPQIPKGLDEWYTGAGGLGGPKDRVVEVGGGNGGSGHGERGSGGGRGGDGSSVPGIGTSRTPGRTQPVMTPGKIVPRGSATASSASGEPGTLPPKGPQGPLLFERTGTTEDMGGSGGPGLKGRVLRGGGGGSGSVSADGNVSVSKVRCTRSHRKRKMSVILVGVVLHKQEDHAIYLVLQA